MDYLARAVEILVAVIVGGIAWWLRRIDKEQDTMRAEIDALKIAGKGLEDMIATIKDILEKHVDREENVLWKRLDETDRRAEVRHLEVIGRLVAVETTLNTNGGKR